ncbi:MAG: DUF3352 domain-containing protein [Nocardioidaceae bacterium]
MLVVLVGGGAFAFIKMDPFHVLHAGPQAAEAVPEDAIGYVGFDLDPSAKQKINALRFLNHFPAFEENVDLEDEHSDVRKAIFNAAIQQTECSGIDYAKDVEPWLGKKFGLAAMPSADDGSEPEVLGVAEVTDTGAAKKALDKLNACATQQGGDGVGYAFDDDYLLVTQTKDLAQKYADAAGDSSLADADDFQADMDSLGDLGVATAWVDIKAVANAMPESTQSQAESVLQGASSRVALTCRFQSDSLELVATGYGATPEIDHDDNPVTKLPESTVFALSESGGGQRLQAAWDGLLDQARSRVPGLDDKLASFESQSGLKLPDALVTLLGKNVLLAADKNGLTDAEALEAVVPSDLNIGVRFTNDPAKLNDLYQKLIDLGMLPSSTSGDLPVTKKDFSDGVVVASNDSYADTLRKLEGDLGSDPAFTSVIDDAANKEFVLFFNFDAVEGPILQAAADSGAPQAVIDNLRPLQAFGVTQVVDGDYNKLTVTLSVNK